MTRRPKKQPRATSRIGSQPWTDEFNKLFPLADADWVRPATVKVSHATSGKSWTFEARFSMANGHPVVLKTKCKRLQSGSISVAEQSFLIRSKVEGPAQ